MMIAADPGAVQQMRQEQPGRAGADDPDLGFHARLGAAAARATALSSFRMRVAFW